jgi:hypothetical protein
MPTLPHEDSQGLLMHNELMRTAPGQKQANPCPNPIIKKALTQVRAFVLDFKKYRIKNVEVKTNIKKKRMLTFLLPCSHIDYI